jgi:hypothetical protein
VSKEVVEEPVPHDKGRRSLTLEAGIVTVEQGEALLAG